MRTASFLLLIVRSGRCFARVRFLRDCSVHHLERDLQIAVRKVRCAGLADQRSTRHLQVFR
ncbi:MAG TPA: hypothetical protein DIW82_04295 [Corynebacterium nuruki]|uniref:Uncharacterized protein n=1 Tax=Corynebacterium nuruki TaxID=1032851 RepID=A0A3D4SY62_9CORY|nr:hypothetical protein [Corynebacterium nuruki]